MQPDLPGMREAGNPKEWNADACPKRRRLSDEAKSRCRMGAADRFERTALAARLRLQRFHWFPPMMIYLDSEPEATTLTRHRVALSRKSSVWTPIDYRIHQLCD